MNKKLFILAFVGELLTACQNDNYFFGNEVRISAGSDTRASGTVWQKQDSIGIFMFKNEDQSVLSHNIEHKNVFEDGAIAVFEPANINEKLYYPVDAAVDLLGYYPYQRGINGYNYKVDVSDQTNLPAIDLITARKNDIRRTNSMQDLKFGHALSKIKLTVKSGAGMTDQEIADAKVWIAGVSTKADYDLSNGAIKALEIGTVDVPQSKGIAEAILVPQTDISGVLFMIDVYPFSKCRLAVPKPTTAFECAMEYCYTITVNRTGEITITSTSIKPWSIGEGNGEMTLDIEYVKVPVTVEPFGMGSLSDEVGHKKTETQHQVTLTKGFMISKYEITAAQYAEFLNQSNAFKVPKDFDYYLCLKTGNGSIVKLCFVYDNSESDLKRSYNRWVGSKKPMTRVTWYGAKAFADWAGVELPTEAQWEYACRAGTTTPWSFDPEMTNLLGSCVYRDSKLSNCPNIGGSKLPNAFGVYDMHGNAPEWCLDYWDGVTPYSNQPVKDPKGPDSGTKCVVRGGGFDDTAELCRSASRSCELLDATESIRYFADYLSVQGLGFRVVINDK